MIVLFNMQLITQRLPILYADPRIMFSIYFHLNTNADAPHFGIIECMHNILNIKRHWGFNIFLFLSIERKMFHLFVFFT